MYKKYLLPIITSLIWARLRRLLFLLIKFKKRGKQGRAHAHGGVYVASAHSQTHTLIHTSWSLWEQLIQWLKGRVKGYRARGPWRGRASPSHKNTPLSLSQHQNHSQRVHSEVNHWRIYMQNSTCHHPQTVCLHTSRCTRAATAAYLQQFARLTAWPAAAALWTACRVWNKHSLSRFHLYNLWSYRPNSPSEKPTVKVIHVRVLNSKYNQITLQS